MKKNFECNGCGSILTIAEDAGLFLNCKTVNFDEREGEWRGLPMKFPDQYRAQHPLGLPHKPGDPFGWFMIPSPVKTGQWMAVQADGQTDWEHVSVSMRNRCPSWEEMCYIKDLFWEPEDTVVQYHPPKSDYVNRAKHCLHLWRHLPGMPRPPKIYVG